MNARPGRPGDDHRRRVAGQGSGDEADARQFVVLQSGVPAGEPNRTLRLAVTDLRADEVCPLDGVRGRVVGVGAQRPLEQSDQLFERVWRITLQQATAGDAEQRLGHRVVVETPEIQALGRRVTPVLDRGRRPREQLAVTPAADHVDVGHARVTRDGLQQHEQARAERCARRAAIDESGRTTAGSGRAAQRCAGRARARSRRR